MSRKNVAWLTAATVLLAAAAGFLPALGAPFMLDDLYIVRDNPLLEGLRPGAILSQGWWGADNPHSGLYRPLTVLALALVRNLAGETPWMFRLMNVLLHALAALLLLGVVCGLGRLTADKGNGRRGEMVAAVAALFFAVHAVHAEAVNFAVGAADLLAAVGALGSLLLVVRYLERGGTRQLAGALVLFLASLLAKESAICLPLAVPGLFLLRSPAGGRRPGAWPLVPAFAATAALALALRFLALGEVAPGGAPLPLSGVPILERGVVMAGVFARYVGLLLFPWPLRAVRDVGPPGNVALAVAGAVLLAAAAIAVVRGRRRDPLLAAGLGFFVLMLLPVANILPIGAVMAERFLYLPSAGFCLALAAFVVPPGWPVRWQTAPRLAAVLAVAALYLALTLLRGADWGSDLRFWSREARLAPGSPLAAANLGRAQHLAGDRKKARESYLLAARLAPREPKPLVNLGILALEENRPEAAARFLERAVALEPGHFEARLALAKLHLGAGDAARAADELRRVRESGHDSAEVERLLGGALLATGREREAEAALERSLRRDRRSVAARMALGNLLLARGSADEAARHFAEGLAMAPRDARLMNNLAISLWQTGRREEASAWLERAAAADPRYANTWLNRGRTREETGDRPGAAADYRRALELRPGWEAALEALGRVQPAPVSPGGS